MNLHNKSGRRHNSVAKSGLSKLADCNCIVVAMAVNTNHNSDCYIDRHILNLFGMYLINMDDALISMDFNNSVEGGPYCSHYCC